MVLNPSVLTDILSDNLNEDVSSSFDNYKISALQFVYDTNFAHVNGVIKKTKVKAAVKIQFLKNSISNWIPIY